MDVRTFCLLYEQSNETSLSVLDDHLREVWLECCNHLSAFEKDAPLKRYIKDDELEPGECSMENIKVL